MVWQTDVNEGAMEDDEQEVEYEDNPDDPDYESKHDLGKVQRENEKIAAQKAAKAKAAEKAVDDFGFDVEEAGAGDERLAVQPWKGQIKAPSNYKRAPKDANLAPAIDL